MTVHNWIYQFPSGAVLQIDNPDNNENLRRVMASLYNIVEKDNMGTMTRYALYPKTRGGGIIDKILGVIFKIFDPIIKPLRAIINCVLMLVKLVLYIVAVFFWIIKFHFWFFVVFLPSLPADISKIVKNITYLLYEALFGAGLNYVRRIVNKVGRWTIYGITAGWDNADDRKPGGEEDACKGGPSYKCYRTEEGTVPFSVIIGTVLCPPVGVFMEYGVLGWFNVLICAILTLLFYFPGLIYALLLLYC